MPSLIEALIEALQAKLAELAGKTDGESVKMRNELILELAKHGVRPQPGPGVHEHFIANVRSK
jgi:hypothetical protein